MVLILNEKSAWLYPSILTDSWKMDYAFQRTCEPPPPPLRKNRRRGVCGRGGNCKTRQSQKDNPFLVLVWKRPITKIPVSSVFNDSGGLYRKTICRWLVRRPHYSVRLMRFGSRGPSEFATEMPWPKLLGNCLGRRRSGTSMAMSTVASEKNRKLLFIGNVFYKQWHFCVLLY